MRRCRSPRERWRDRDETAEPKEAFNRAGELPLTQTVPVMGFGDVQLTAVSPLHTGLQAVQVQLQGHGNIASVAASLQCQRGCQAAKIPTVGGDEAERRVGVSSGPSVLARSPSSVTLQIF